MPPGKRGSLASTVGLSLIPGTEKQSAHPERNDGMRLNPIERKKGRGTDEH
jgi:hypothetical protein